MRELHLLFLSLAESVHAILHVKVFLGVGKLYTVAELESKRLYFFMDLFTVLCSYYAILVEKSDISLGDYRLLTFFTTIHFLLHAFYVAQWSVPDSYFVASIIQWSAEKSHLNRMKLDGSIMYLYNTLGTLFDITTHMLLATYLYDIFR
jgi:hypothetical protein